ncbi:hypothetical protein H1Q78_05580 [Cellulosimicrobium cellulans]|uniref:hypothetical protein n=1 Tax=Cellulosimicrobium cellulans TaxID=1710 RepID=UPI001EDC6815|nr:hypothetical protein [Cellulosimicrobium cellulans]UKJ64856.1 hypothetical protein H1Q78_05580 [Cellulosimicrobium cellulans]
MAQPTEVVPLDEPTGVGLEHLVDVLDLVVRVEGRAVVTVLHNQGLAARCSDARRLQP